MVMPKAMSSLWPMRDAGQRRLARADDVEAGRVEADDIAQRGHAELAVRIVGEDGAAGFGLRRRRRPSCWSLRSAALSISVGELRVGIDAGALLGQRAAAKSTWLVAST